MRTRDRLIWCALLVALWGHWHLFAAQVRRHVSWSYAANFDQTASLHRAYKAYDDSLRKGTLPALAASLRDSPAVSTILHLAPLPIFAVMGPSRLAVLAVNWLAFALLQVATVGGARRLGGWPLAALALGLVWAAASPFSVTGGLDDFRADFVALCLYGTFVAAVLWSDVFRRRGRAVAAGGVAGLLLMERSLTAVYLGGLLLAFGAVVIVRWWRSTGPDAREDARRMLGNLSLHAAVLAVVGLPVLGLRAERLWDYYVVGHITGGEKYIRAWGAGVFTLLDTLAYYPRGGLVDHAGPFLLALAALSLLALRLGRQPEAPPLARTPLRHDRFIFVALCLVVPVVVLTLDVAKSPLAVGIVVPALVWLFVLAAADLSARTSSRVRALVAATCLAAAGAWHVRQLTRPPRQLWSVEARLEVLRLHDAMTSVCRARGWASPLVFGDRQRDYLPAARVSAYERHRTLLDVQQPLGPGVLAPSDAVIGATMERSHLFLVTRPHPDDVLHIPFDRALRTWHDRVREYCAAELELVGTFHVPEEVKLYARPTRTARSASPP